MSRLKKRTVNICILFDNEIRDCATKFTLWQGASSDGDLGREAFHDFAAAFVRTFKDLIEKPNSPIALASQDSRLHEELMREVIRNENIAPKEAK